MTHERVLESVKVSGGGPGFGARYSANPLIRYSAMLLCRFSAVLPAPQRRCCRCWRLRARAWHSEMGSTDRVMSTFRTTLPQHPERVAWPQLSSDAGNADAEPTERLQLILCGAV